MTCQTFDGMLNEHIGDWGRGQMIILLASSLSWSALAMIVLSMVFVTQKPDWVCTHATDAQCMRLQQRGGDGFCELSVGQYTWLQPHSSLVSSFSLICNDSWKVGLVNAVFFFGYWVGSSVFGSLADKWGRKWCLLLSNLTSACSALLCASSSSYWWYIAWRTALGFCCTGLPVAAYVLSTETVGPSFRGRAGTYNQLVYHVGEWLLPLLALWLQNWRWLNVAIACYCILTAALMLPFPESPRWLLLHGRHQEAEQTLSWLAHLNGRPPLPAGLVEAHCPSTASTNSTHSTHSTDAEGSGSAPCSHAASIDALTTSDSDRAQGTAAKQLVTASSFCTDSDDEGCEVDVSCCSALLGVCQPDSPKPHVHSKPQSSEVLAGDPDRAQQQPMQAQQQQQHGESLWQVFKHQLLMRYFVVSALLCSVLATTFYVANLATDDLQGSLYMNFFLTSLGEVPFALAAAVAVDWVGRRITVGTGLFITGAACCSCSILPVGWWTTTLASIGKGACSGSWTVAYIYAAELFPTSLRSAALAGTNQASRLGGVLAPAIVYVSEQLAMARVLPFAVIGCASILTAVLLGKLPETLAKGQPDTTADLDRMYGSQHTNTNSSSASEGQQGSLQSWFSPQRWRQLLGIGLPVAYVDDSIAVDRKGSKLQRLLSMCMSSRSSGSWVIPAGSGNDGKSGWLQGASWQAVPSDEIELGQQQQQQGRLGLDGP